MHQTATQDTSARKLLGMLFAGYGTLLLLMGVGLSITLYSGAHIAEIGDDIVRVHQPITFLSQKLEADLNLSTSALNAFLLTGNPENYQHHEALRSAIGRQLLEFEQRFPQQPGQRAPWQEIRGLIEEYNRLARKVAALNGDNGANYPGIALASEQLHPLNMNYQTFMHGLLEQVTQQRQDALLSRLHEMRRLWMLMTSEFRVFLATRAPSNRANTVLYLEQHDELLRGLVQGGDYPDDYELEIEELRTLSAEYRKRLPAVFEILAGEQWRGDAYLMKSEVQPLVATLQQRLSEQATQQLLASQEAATALADELDAMRHYNLAILAFGLLFGALISYIISRGIYTMVGRIRQSSRLAREHASKLQRSLQQLEATQAQLIHSERLASLGGLVAGISHEVNTPLGISVTASSHIQGKAEALRREMAAGTLKKSGLLDFLDEHAETMGILSANLQRAAELVRSFKQVAVDQTSEQLREFEVGEFLGDVLRSLQPELKHRPITTELECDTPQLIHSYPGALSQIVTNLVVNSLHHAFAAGEAGQIKLSVQFSDSEMLLLYSDNGSGIPEADLGKIFDPFFTTKRGQGGSGLGLHIIYNIVTGQLGGGIECESQLGRGTLFSIRVPKNRIEGEGQRDE